MSETKIPIASRDGLLLDSILLESTSTSKGAVLMAGGTGIKKEFYLNFARYLQEQGYHVLLFDYRGIGGSKPKSPCWRALAARCLTLIFRGGSVSGISHPQCNVNHLQAKINPLCKTKPKSLRLINHTISAKV